MCTYNLMYFCFLQSQNSNTLTRSTMTSPPQEVPAWHRAGDPSASEGGASIPLKPYQKGNCGRLLSVPGFNSEPSAQNIAEMMTLLDHELFRSISKR